MESGYYAVGKSYLAKWLIKNFYKESYMIGIIDAQSGNIGSVENALNKLNIQFLVITKKSQIKSGLKLILPGVGSFHRLMKNLVDLDLLDSIKDFVNKNNPFLGICVGMQILLSFGLEEKKTEGLGVFQGEVVKFEKSLNQKIPLISWIKISENQNKEKNLLLKNCKDMNFYFLHSFFCDIQNKDKIIAYSNYGNKKYPAIINQGKIYGVQFHPEKSSNSGLQLLKNFSEIN